MKVETRDALIDYYLAFGVEWHEDLDGLKHSEEPALVKRIYASIEDYKADEDE